MIMNRKMSTWNQLPMVLMLWGGFSLWGSAPTMAQEMMIRTLSVTGEGIEVIPTSLSQISLGIEIQGNTAQEVQQQIAQRSDALVKLLDSLKVSKLQTTGLNLQPVYDYSDDQRRLVGYVGTNTVSFEVNTNQAGAIIDQAVKTGATRIDGIGFIASDDAIAAAEQLALVEATVDAQNQAQQVLKALNLEAQEIISIQINGANGPVSPYPQNVRGLASLSMEAADFKTIVVGGEQSVRASVTLHVRY